MTCKILFCNFLAFLLVIFECANHLDKLNMCIVDHTAYSDMLEKFKSFATTQTEMAFSKCSIDLKGEKSDILDKIDIINQLKANLKEGDYHVKSLEKQSEIVKQSTSVSGIKYLESNLR